MLYIYRFIYWLIIKMEKKTSKDKRLPKTRTSCKNIGHLFSLRKAATMSLTRFSRRHVFLVLRKTLSCHVTYNDKCITYIHIYIYRGEPNFFFLFYKGSKTKTQYNSRF